MVFKFDKPETKDFTETVRLLAGLSRFVSSRFVLVRLVFLVARRRSGKQKGRRVVPDGLVRVPPCSSVATWWTPRSVGTVRSYGHWCRWPRSATTDLPARTRGTSKGARRRPRVPCPWLGSRTSSSSLAVPCVRGSCGVRLRFGLFRPAPEGPGHWAERDQTTPRKGGSTEFLRRSREFTERGVHARSGGENVA